MTETNAIGTIVLNGKLYTREFVGFKSGDYKVYAYEYYVDRINRDKTVTVYRKNVTGTPIGRHVWDDGGAISVTIKPYGKEVILLIFNIEQDGKSVHRNSVWLVHPKFSEEEILHIKEAILDTVIQQWPKGLSSIRQMGNVVIRRSGVKLHMD